MTSKTLAIFPLVAVTTFAQAGYFTAATGMGGTNMRRPTGKVGHDYGNKLSSAINISTSGSSNDASGSDLASSVLQVLTEMGRIHAKAETYGTHHYDGAGNEGVDGGFAFVFPNSEDFSQYGPLPGNPFAGGYWEDVLHVRSSTLANGTAVLFASTRRSRGRWTPTCLTFRTRPGLPWPPISAATP